jgi:hypothetical protein
VGWGFVGIDRVGNERVRRTAWLGLLRGCLAARCCRVSKSDGAGAAKMKMRKVGREGDDLVIHDDRRVKKVGGYRTVLAQCRRMERWPLDAR